MFKDLVYCLIFVRFGLGTCYPPFTIQKGTPDLKQTMEEAEIDEKIVFDQLNGSANAVWSLLLATGYLKVLDLRILDEDEEGIGEEGDVWCFVFRGKECLIG